MQQFLKPNLVLRNPPKVGPTKSPILLDNEYKVDAISFEVNSSKFLSYIFNLFYMLIKPGTFKGAPAPPIKHRPINIDIIFCGRGNTGYINKHPTVIINSPKQGVFSMPNLSVIAFKYLRKNI